MKNIFHADHPVWAMAFRPLYLLAALYGAIAVLLWGFGYTGTTALPVQYWHAHEMIWGYAGAVVVAFLLTASATWTGQAPVRGRFLMVLTALWLLARCTAFVAVALPLTAVAGTLFFWLAAWGMGQMVWRSRNRRNYPAVAALFGFGLAHGLFHLHLADFDPIALHRILLAGLMIVAAFIGLIGHRIIPFFTAKRLNSQQITSPEWVAYAALLLPLTAALLFGLQVAQLFAAGLCVLAGAVGMVQSVRWFERGLLRESMLWVLHIGYLASALGLLLLGLSPFLPPQSVSLAIHLIAVGGIGVLTLGMMTRTALGHTGRQIYPAPKGLTVAFGLMCAAAVVRALAALMMTVDATAYTHALRTSAVLFAAALLIYFWRYRPWLLQARQDGKAG